MLSIYSFTYRTWVVVVFNIKNKHSFSHWIFKNKNTVTVRRHAYVFYWHKSRIDIKFRKKRRIEISHWRHLLITYISLLQIVVLDMRLNGISINLKEINSIHSQTSFFEKILKLYNATQVAKRYTQLKHTKVASWLTKFLRNVNN